MNRIATGQLQTCASQVTCLLFNKGGWWSLSCIANAVQWSGKPRLGIENLVLTALIELVRIGEVVIGTVEGCEPMFRYPSSPFNEGYAELPPRHPLW